MKIWPLAKGKLIKTLSVNTDSIESIRYSDTGGILAVGSLDKTVTLWTTANWRKLSVLNTTSAPLTVNFNRANEVLTVDVGSELKSWEIKPTPVSISTTQLDKSEGDGESAVVNRDGSLLAIGSGSGKISLVDLNTAKIIRVFDNHTVGYYGVVFSNDRQWLATAGFDNTVKLWDLRTGRSLPSLRGHTGRVTSVAFHPDNRRIISASVDHTIRVWDTITGHSERVLTGHSNSI